MPALVLLAIIFSARTPVIRNIADAKGGYLHSVSALTTV